MIESHKIFLHDRIKETSYTIGTGNFTLNGAANGFSSFGSVYDSGDNIFYAATDGTFYEIGSGIYTSGVQNSIVRFPFRSSNTNNSVVNFGEGLKEIYVTYPATNSVYSASGLQGYNAPQTSGIPFWSSSNILNYNANLLWDNTNSKLGIRRVTPVFTLDIGGSAAESIIRSSGLYVGSSGITFPSGNNGNSSYLGGVQLAHYEPNQLNSLTGSDQILELSGVAKNTILFKQQSAGLVFAGPASGCTPPCSPDYPSFRPLLVEDIHDLDATVVDNGSGLSIYQKLGINTTKLDGSVTVYNNSFNSGTPSGWLKASYLTSGNYGGGISILDTSNSSKSGYSIFTTISGVNLNIGCGSSSGSLSMVLAFDSFTSGVSNSTMDFYGNKLRIRNDYTPSSSSGVGNAGDICWDSGYLYVCVATNSWKRSNLTAW